MAIRRPQLTEIELSHARRWRDDDGVSVREIARRLGRTHGAMQYALREGAEARGGCRKPPAITEKDGDRAVKVLDDMVKKAKGEYRVTSEMLKKEMKLKCTNRTLLANLRSRGVYFRPMRQKPLLTDADVADRKAFAEEYLNKQPKWWAEKVHMVIDVKYFKVFLGKDHRSRAAREGTWGAFRKKGQGLQPHYVRPSKGLKWNPGARGVHVLAGVGNGKVMLWQYVPALASAALFSFCSGRAKAAMPMMQRSLAPSKQLKAFLWSTWRSSQMLRSASIATEDGKKWCSQVAADMYAGPIRKALQREFPGRRSWTVLEDNDPSGFRSRAGLAAKEAAKIVSFEIPKRSPDLNVCDYALWAEVNRRMRCQEKRMAPNKRETRSAFKARLRRTALRLPETFVNPAMRQMRTQGFQI
jgi:hypothetical protein